MNHSSNTREIRPASGPLRGELSVPGDKSISHRACMLGALSEGTTEIHHFLSGADCLSTIDCFRQMGVNAEWKNVSEAPVVLIRGRGLHGLSASASDLDCGNSGTTTRLISGILAGQRFSSRLIGDASLSSRPMRRILDPLRLMGADIRSETERCTLPLRIAPADLHGVFYDSPVASAQVKSCVLLAGLYADGETTVREPAPSRDHTERMLAAFAGQDLSQKNAPAASGILSASPVISVSARNTVSVRPEPRLCGQKVFVPGDISSAAYFLCAGALVPGSEILLRNVGTNQTRDGILRVLASMGASVERQNERLESGEPAADLLVRFSSLHGTVIEGDLIPTLIDELPVIAVLAAYADGTTVIRDAAELRVKESDRIAVVTEGLQKMGADVTATDDGFVIRGGKPLHGAVVDSHMDHRIAMAFSVAALAAEGPVTIQGADCISISYPEFFRDLQHLMP